VIRFAPFTFQEIDMSVRTDSDGNPVLDQFSEEGFVDLVFRIHDLAADDGHYRFHVSASHQGEEVGMDVIVVKGIKGGFDPGMNLVKAHVYRKGVRFLRSGQESDRLVATLAALYGSRSRVEQMVAEEAFTAIALHQGDLDMDKDPVKLKLFGRDSEPFDESAYYESFFNLDLANGKVYWNEKDPDYRESLLRALAVG
jgi:hypothetical protein